MTLERPTDPRWTGHLMFLGALVRNPRAVGAIMPSSAILARRMVRDVRPDSRVVELGPGTGGKLMVNPKSATVAGVTVPDGGTPVS